MLLQLSGNEGGCAAAACRQQAANDASKNLVGHNTTSSPRIFEGRDETGQELALEVPSVKLALGFYPRMAQACTSDTTWMGDLELQRAMGERAVGER